MAQHTDMKFRWKAFGKDLRKYRNAEGLGLRECARELKIHHATWCRAEQGRPITVPHYLFLCSWMHSEPEVYAVRLY